MASNFKSYLKEGLMIVFSVLFALFINKLFGDYQTAQKKEIALESIKKELAENAEMLEEWTVNHVEIRDRITSVLYGRNDSLRAKIVAKGHFNLGELTEQENLIDGFLSSTAWETAKTTGIITEFDFETTKSLTHVYKLQEVITERSLMKILDYFFDTDAHDINRLDQTLVQFHLRFWELTGQEQYLKSLYETSLKELDK